MLCCIIVLHHINIISCHWGGAERPRPAEGVGSRSAGCAPRVAAGSYERRRNAEERDSKLEAAASEVG